MAGQFDPTGYHLTFDDEFNQFDWYNGNSGTWKTTFGGGERSLADNGEREIYLDPDGTGGGGSGINPFHVDNGVLTITAQPLDGDNYASGLISTSSTFDQTYGYFEMRAQLPEGQGLWPAFWMAASDGTWPPELDIMEVLGNDPTKLYTTAHTRGPDGGDGGVGFAPDVPDLSQGFHTFAAEWTPSDITWYLDNQEVAHTATPDDMHRPMYLMANLAVGGSWPGLPDDSTPFPAEMKIDYIRAYSKDEGVPAVSAPDGETATPPGGDGTSDGTAGGDTSNSGSPSHADGDPGIPAGGDGSGVPPVEPDAGSGPSADDTDHHGETGRHHHDAWAGWQGHDDGSDGYGQDGDWGGSSHHHHADHGTWLI